MQSDSKALLAVFAAALMALSMAVVVAMPASDAAESLPEGEEYDKDLGQFWSMSVQFLFDGAQTSSIEWDFGDGTPVSNEYDPAHTFPAIGTYTVKQTTTNPQGSTVEYYKVEIMGYPYVTLVYGNGEEDGKIQMTSGGINAAAAEKPADPVWEGHEFTGWYTDKDCTEAYDWTEKVDYPVTLYAGWDTEKTPVDPGEDDGDADGERDMICLIGAVVCGVLAIVCLALAPRTNYISVIGTVVFVIAAAVLALLYFEVI